MGKMQQLARKLGGAGIASIEKAYRAMVRSAHPDTGGDPAAFRALTAARDQLMKRANALLLHVRHGPRCGTSAKGETELTTKPRTCPKATSDRTPRRSTQLARRRAR